MEFPVKVNEADLLLYYDNEYDLNFVYRLYPRIKKINSVRPGAWTIRSVYNEEIMIDHKFYKVVIWSEVNSPYARNAYQKVHNGGLLVYDDSGIYYTNRRFCDYKLDRTIENKGNDICVFRNYVYGRGEVAEYLLVCRAQKRKLLELAVLQVGMNDAGAGGGICIDNRVEYKDVNKNGIKDICIEIYSCSDGETVSRTNIIF